MGNEIVEPLYKIISNFCFVFCLIFREKDDIYKEHGVAYLFVFTWEITKEWLFTVEFHLGVVI